MSDNGFFMSTSRFTKYMVTVVLITSIVTAIIINIPSTTIKEDTLAITDVVSTYEKVIYKRNFKANDKDDVLIIKHTNTWNTML